MTQPRPAVLFDLDGTLVDTAEDLAAALWAACDRFGRERPPLAAARTAIGDGGPGLVRLAFGENAPEHADALAHLLDYYANNIAEHSRVYAPLDQLLDALDAREVPWGVVTNKRVGLARSLLDDIGVVPTRDCIIGGDSLEVAKPHPAPLLHAAAILEVAAEHCVYIGDHSRDIDAGKAAGMRCIAAGYGYISTEEDPTQWGAEAIAPTPAELATHIEQFLTQHSGAAA
ncbi:MAG: HAD-IA family hydrolase [Pseudomonadota bacterium]